jgi:hypothetical protein
VHAATEHAASAHAAIPCITIYTVGSYNTRYSGYPLHSHHFGSTCATYAACTAVVSNSIGLRHLGCIIAISAFTFHIACAFRHSRQCFRTEYYSCCATHVFVLPYLSF